MANGQQAFDDQFDVLEHPTLGTLKFPKGMGVDERNASIDRLLSQQADAPQTSTHTSPLAPGSYQGRKGGPVLDPNQSVAHTAITGIERSFGIDRPTSLADAYSQVGKGLGRLAIATAKDPFALITGMSDMIEGGMRDIGSGISKKDPRQVASGAGQLFGILSQGEAGKES